MKHMILILSALTGISASAANLQMNANVNVGLHLKAEDALTTRDARCAFISTQLFRCVLGVNLAKVSGVGTPQIRVVNKASDSDNDLFPGLYRVDMNMSGNNLIVDFNGQEAQRLMSKAYPYNAKDPDASQKRIRNLGEIVVNERQFNDAEEPFRIGLQKSSFPEVFNLVDAILQKLVDGNKIEITQSWSMGFGYEESKTIVTSYCASDKGQESATCKTLRSLGR